MPILSKEKLSELLVTTLTVINGNPRDLPRINESNYDAWPFIEIESYGYYYVCYERDTEIFRTLTFDEEELLFLVFRDITNSMAWRWERNNRVAGQDSRRLSFTKKIELMTKIKPEFGTRIQKELDEILRDHPYNDK